MDNLTISFRQIVAATAITALLAGCSAKNAAQVLPAAQHSRFAQSDAHGNGVADPVATPTRLVFSSKDAASKTVTVTVQYSGDLTAVSSDTNIATVDPQTVTPTVTQNDGGMKSATLTVTPVWFGTTTITITDKKGSTATVTVVVNDGGIFN